MSILFYVSLPFPSLTPGLTKERRTPAAHSLRAYGIHVSGSFTLALHHSRLSLSFPGGCTVPKLSRTPAFEMPTRNTNICPKTKRVPRSYPNNNGIIMRGCRVACHGFQQALILAFRLIITPYHSKACRYLQSDQARSDRPSKPDCDPRPSPACHQKSPAWPDWPLAYTAPKYRDFTH